MNVTAKQKKMFILTAFKKEKLKKIRKCKQN